MTARTPGLGTAGLETPVEGHPDPVGEAGCRSRLVWTLNGYRLHLSHPVRYYRTLCGHVAEGAPAFPDAAVVEHQVCSRCRAAYDRELAHG